MQTLEIAADAPAAREGSGVAYVPATAFEHCLFNSIMNQAAAKLRDADEKNVDLVLYAAGGACPSQQCADLSVRFAILHKAATCYADSADSWWSIWCASGEPMSRIGVHP